MEEKPYVEIYTDGAAEPNPGPGGYGVVLFCPKLNYKKEISEGFVKTTNNRMELLAVIEGLKQLKYPSVVKVFSDSQYVVNAVSLGWLEKWEQNNWIRNKTEWVANDDLWKELSHLLKVHDVSICWIKGHAGHSENERCDFLAVSAAKKENRIEDMGYYANADKESKSLKITKEGDFCRKCSTPVVKIENRNPKKKKKHQYYYEYFFLCPKCKTYYMVEDAKRAYDLVGETGKLFE